MSSQPETEKPKPAFFYTPQRLIFPLAVIGLYWGAWLGVGFTDIGMFPKFLVRAGLMLLMSLLIAVWWLFFSRVKIGVRLAIFALLIACGVGAWLLQDPTVLTPVVLMWSLPAVCTASVLWLTITQTASAAISYSGLAVIILLSWSPGPLMRMEGLAGDGSADVYWRWSASAEDRFLTNLPESVDPPEQAAETLEAQPGDWSAFRGPTGDGKAPGLVIETDWQKHPPVEKWRHPIGPGWSSMLIIGDRLFTQEQRGEIEATTCYSADTGEQLWVDETEVRFEEALGGVGPRATPAFGDGRIYSMSAVGRLDCFNALTGDEIWSRELAQDYEASVPVWGFSVSPLFYEGAVYVFVDGKEKAMLALNAETGEELWSSDVGGESYSSPVLLTLHDTPQVAYLSRDSLTSFDPKTGDELWRFEPPGGLNRPTMQPQVVEKTNVLFSFSPSNIQKIEVARSGDKWSVKEVWDSRQLKPDFSDYLVHDGHVYGFDGNIFACIDLKAGDRQWKKGRYGAGQALLLADQPILLVVTETGVLKLVNCNPDALEEVASFQAIEGKTWNHLAVQGSRLYVRNSQEIACFELPLREGD